MAEWMPEQPLLAANALWPDVPTVTPDTTLEAAGALLADVRSDLLPVMEGDRLVGTVSVRDLAVSGCGTGRDPAVSTVSEVMNPEPPRLAPDVAAAEALDQMHMKGMGAILVQKEGGALVGVLSIHRLYELLYTSSEDGPLPDHVRRVRGEGL